MLVLVAPGQGAQTPGFLTPWLDLPGAADRIAAWSDAIGLDLAHYGTKADADEIRDTAVAQPLLVAAGLLSAAALGDVTPGAVAGHSVGEITAAAFAGVLDDERRAPSSYARAAWPWPRPPRSPRPACRRSSAATPRRRSPHLEKLGLTPANVNGGGQIVAAGTAGAAGRTGRGQARGRPPRRGAEGGRRVPHAPHGPGGRDAAEAAADLDVADPRLHVRLERGRPGGRHRRRGHRAAGRPGRQPGPLGPVHGDLQGARRHRADRGLPRRHAHRSRQARAARGADPRAEDPRRPRRGPRAHRRARER